MLAFPSFSTLSFRSALLSPVPQTLLVSGYPGHDELTYFRVRSFRSDCFGFRLSLSVSAISSAVRIRRPRHLLRLGLLPAGRLSTSELVGAWGKAPSFKLNISPSDASVSDVTNVRCTSRRKTIACLRPKLKPDCYVAGQESARNLRKMSRQHARLQQQLIRSTSCGHHTTLETSSGPMS